MREIKFRAFEKSLKEMIHVNTIDFDRCIINGDLAWRTFDEVVLMQFTGMKDKNGVEIYDGDIVEIEKMVFEISVSSNHGYRFMWGEELLCVYHAYRGSIVGNIHENPELVKC